MAVRTAETRAMLMGEGKARQELGETLVQITKHGTACPLCVPFENKVLIDDVYSGGTWENSKEAYEKVPKAKRAAVRFMSEAMKEGLYHPRCRHGLGTFYVELLEDEKNVISLEESNKKWYNNNAKSGLKDTGKRYAVGEIIKLTTSELIAQRFTYVDDYGTPHNPFDDGFKQLPIETQQEIAAGIEYVQEHFNIKTLPSIITAEKMQRGIMGAFVVKDGKRIIRFSTALKDSTSEAFATAVHEMVHYIDESSNGFAKDIYKEALRNLKLRANAREAYALRAQIVGIYNKRDVDNAAELLAYAVESVSCGKGNSLAKEMYNVFVRRLKK